MLPQFVQPENAPSPGRPPPHPSGSRKTCLARPELQQTKQWALDGGLPIRVSVVHVESADVPKPWKEPGEIS